MQIQMQIQMQYNNYFQNPNYIYTKNECPTDKSQESNSSSLLSTTSDGEQINNNINIYKNSGEENIIKENKNLYDGIKKSIKDIGNYYNSIDCLGDFPNLACLYYCDIETNNNDEFFINLEIKNLIDDYNNDIKNNIKNKKGKNIIK